MDDTVDMFCFKEALRAGSPTYVCVVDENQARRFISRQEIDAIFFGRLIYGSIPSEPGYVGVWSARNASRLRALLRARGARLRIQDGAPPARLLVRTTHVKARANAKTRD